MHESRESLRGFRLSFVREICAYRRHQLRAFPAAWLGGSLTVKAALLWTMGTICLQPPAVYSAAGRM